MAVAATGMPIPTGWGLTQFAIHQEQADTTGGVPFTGTIMCQLRLDVAGASPQAVRDQDRALFQKSYDHFELVSQGELTVGARRLPQIGYRLVEPDQQQKLEQWVVYFQRGTDVYMLTATHRVGAPFERVRATALQVLEGLLGP